jgi:hypothetical protein
VRRLLLIGIVLTGLLCPSVLWAADPLPRSVLVLSQGFSGAPWPTAVHQAIRSALNARVSSPVAVYIEELDLARFGGPQFEQALVSYLRERYRQKEIGVVVAVGSDALELVLNLRKELWTEVPVAFAAVDEATARGLKYPSNVTGSTMRLRFQDAVTAARILVPNFNRIVLVGRKPIPASVREGTPGIHDGVGAHRRFDVDDDRDKEAGGCAAKRCGHLLHGDLFGWDRKDLDPV